MKKAQINGTTYVYGLKDNVVKIAILSQSNLHSQCNLYQNPNGKKKKSQWHFLQKIVKNLKFIGKCKTSNSQSNFSGERKNMEVTIFDFKIYHKAALVEMVWYGTWR